MGGGFLTRTWVRDYSQENGWLKTAASVKIPNRVTGKLRAPSPCRVGFSQPPVKLGTFLLLACTAWTLFISLQSLPPPSRSECLHSGETGKQQEATCLISLLLPVIADRSNMPLLRPVPQRFALNFFLKFWVLQIWSCGYFTICILDILGFNYLQVSFKIYLRSPFKVNSVLKLSYQRAKWFIVSKYSIKEQSNKNECIFKQTVDQSVFVLVINN